MYFDMPQAAKTLGLTSMRYVSIGSMSNRCRPDSLYYLGYLVTISSCRNENITSCFFAEAYNTLDIYAIIHMISQHWVERWFGADRHQANV